jgi:uncharacterized RDD family membrane protein YckC
MTCVICAYENERGVASCIRCGVDMKVVVAPERQHPRTQPAPQRYELASFESRIIANILDSILLWSFYVFVGMLIAVTTRQVTRYGFWLSAEPFALALVVVAVVGLGYFTWFEGVPGATLGKAAMSLQVRNADGTRVGTGPAFIRNLWRISDGLGFNLVGYWVAKDSTLRQRYGDQQAGTIVVQHPASAREGATVLLGALTIAFLVCAFLIHHRAPVSAYSDMPQVSAFTFHQSQGGPARELTPYQAGDTVFVSMNITGLRRDAQGLMKATFLVTTLDPTGISIADGQEFTVSQPQPAGHPVTADFHLKLPPFAPSGDWHFDIRFRDLVSGIRSSFNQSFEVNTPQTPVTSQLEVRDLVLSTDNGNSEDPNFVVKAGSKITMSCKVFGLQFRGSEINIRVAFKLIAPNGSVLVNEPKYLEVQQAFSYHPASFFLPLTAELTLPDGAEKGTYIEQYTVSDAVSVETTGRDIRFRYE